MVIAPEIAALLDLRARVVLVMGSGGGIGAGIARRLYAAGARVAVHYARGRAAAETLARELGERARVVRGDVERDAERMCGDVTAAFGRIDAVVNNAGIQPVAPLAEFGSTGTDSRPIGPRREPLARGLSARIARLDRRRRGRRAVPALRRRALDHRRDARGRRRNAGTADVVKCA